MKVVVLGGGVVGVTTAYYLAKAGHQVEVIDRQPGVALETSFANAGEISPGYSSPWAGPSIPKKAFHWLLMKYGPLAVYPTPDPWMWVWIARMLRNCTHARYELNKSRMVGIAEYSRDCFKALRAETGITYDDRAQGTLQLFRTQKQLDGIAEDLKVLDRYGVPYEVLDRDGCTTPEPGLAAVREKFVGGLRLPNDETGDCQMFTGKLAALAGALGVTFRFETSVKQILADGGRITGIETDKDILTADHYVVALGPHSPFLLRPIGIPVPVYPVKGYSITVPIVKPERAPESTVMDETYKIAITRLGDRIRVGGTAELSGYSTTLRAGRRATLEHSVGDLFPGAGDLSQATFWTGLRPMTPDGPPIVGPTRYPNLSLNTGHGTLGWTMSCGSARVLADQISGRTPEIDVRDLAFARYA